MIEAAPDLADSGLATIEEIANIVAFVPSSAAAVVSGAAIRAEGGLLKGVY